MSDQKIRFEDGASYERMMGTWSRLAGIDFLHWLVPGSGLRWIDGGCGNGGFGRSDAPTNVNPNEFPADYRTELVKYLTLNLSEVGEFRNAFVAEPAFGLLWHMLSMILRP